MATFRQVIFLISPLVVHAGEILEFARPKATPPFPGCVQVVHGVDFHTTPSVPLQIGVKFEHFVYPLRVEGDVNKKRRLR